MSFPMECCRGHSGPGIIPLHSRKTNKKRKHLRDARFIFLSAPSAASVSGDTYFDEAYSGKSGHVLRDVVWCILFLRRKFGDGGYFTE